MVPNVTKKKSRYAYCANVFGTDKFSTFVCMTEKKNTNFRQNSSDISPSS